VSGYRVWIVEQAEQDLVELHRYVAANDSPARADDLLDKLEGLCAALAQLPLRGQVPLELERINITAYREIHFKPYRVIYQVRGRDVFVHCVVDGRRDMLSLLERRLLR